MFVEMHHKTGILSAKLLVYYLIFLEICHTMCIKSKVHSLLQKNTLYFIRVELSGFEWAWKGKLQA